MSDSLALVEPAEEEKKAPSLVSDYEIRSIDERYILGSEYDKNDHQQDNANESLFTLE